MGAGCTTTTGCQPAHSAFVPKRSSKQYDIEEQQAINKEPVSIWAYKQLRGISKREERQVQGKFMREISAYTTDSMASGINADSSSYLPASGSLPEYLH